MSALDEILERLVNEPEFAAHLRDRPDEALAGYELTEDERTVVSLALSDDPGRSGSVEPRHSKSALLGMAAPMLDGLGGQGGGSETIAEPEVQLAELDPQQQLAELDPQQQLAELDPQQQLAELDPQQQLAELDPQQQLAELDPQQQLAELDPQLQLAELDPQLQLAELDPELHLAEVEPEQHLAEVGSDTPGSSEEGLHLAEVNQPGVVEDHTDGPLVVGAGEPVMHTSNDHLLATQQGDGPVDVPQPDAPDDPGQGGNPDGGSQGGGGAGDAGPGGAGQGPGQGQGTSSGPPHLAGPGDPGLTSGASDAEPAPDGATPPDGQSIGAEGVAASPVDGAPTGGSGPSVIDRIVGFIRDAVSGVVDRFGHLRRR